MDYTEIDVRRGRAVLVVRGAIRLDGALVVAHGVDQLTPDVRENAEVLLDARKALAGLAAALTRLEQTRARLVQGAGAQRQTTHRVERLGREDALVERVRDLVP